MKRRKQIFRLLNEFSIKEKVPHVTIKGCRTGATLYEGSLFHVPFGLCIDYVLRHEVTENELVITSTCSPYQTERNVFAADDIIASMPRSEE